MPSTYSQRLGAEFIGTAFLLAGIVGSGIMAERLAEGNTALALLCHTTAIGAILVVLITMLGPLSGAHFNPAVTLAFGLRREIELLEAGGYMFIQIAGAIAGVWAVHLMFDETLLQFSQKSRTGMSQWFSEWVATFGLVFVILMTLRSRADAVAMSVGLYIASACWFTASTSFANPAVTIARSLSDTFSGIAPEHVGAFVVVQVVGSVCALYVCELLTQSGPVQESVQGNAAE